MFLLPNRIIQNWNCKEENWLWIVSCFFCNTLQKQNPLTCKKKRDVDMSVLQPLSPTRMRHTALVYSHKRKAVMEASIFVIKLAVDSLCRPPSPPSTRIVATALKYCCPCTWQAFSSDLTQAVKSGSLVSILTESCLAGRPTFKTACFSTCLVVVWLSTWAGVFGLVRYAHVYIFCGSSGVEY